jgi:voltage-gated potassium channel
LGITGGLFFSVLETVAPGSFVNTAMDHQRLALEVFVQNPSEVSSWMLDLSRVYYFAFVTLTTVGYGDIVPSTPTAQMASVALSISGPLYIALVMGLLISRYTVQAEKQDDDQARGPD